MFDVGAVGSKWVMVIAIMAAILLTTGTAGAKDEQIPKNLDSGDSGLEADLRQQEAALDSQVGDLAEVGLELEQAQTQADATASRAQDLQNQTHKLNQELEAQEQVVADSRSQLEDRLAAAYKGRSLEGMLLLLESAFNSGANPDAVLSNQAIQQLVKDRGSIQYYQGEKQRLKNVARQLNQKEDEYDATTEERQRKVEELRRREEDLAGSIGGLRAEKGRTASRLDQTREKIPELQAAREQAELLEPPASGGGAISREEELQIAREELIVRPVEPLPLSDYTRLYKEAAEDYGFGPDWYVLKAVGKLESNHGENMGPSSAGALGPMQFLPSTWEAAGVDGNGDGVANIMDPEDAIPAAAKYLADSGAPEDWYAALYAYNHAGWYVRQVLEVAERYRILAGDDTVGPYVAQEADPAPTTTEESVEPPTNATPENPEQPVADPEPPVQEPVQSEDKVSPERAEDETAPERTEDEISPEPAEDETLPERTTSRAEDATVPQYQY